MKILTKIISLFVLLLFAKACTSTQNNSNNLAEVYLEHDHYFIKELSVLNINDSISELSVSIEPNKLLFVKKTDSKTPSARYQIKYVVYESLSKKSVNDSSVSDYTMSKDQSDSIAHHKIPFKALKGKNYYIEVSAKDINRSSQFSVILDLAKKNESARNYFSAVQNGKHIGNNSYVDTNKLVTISNKAMINSTIYMKCYFRSFKLPLAPFDLNAPESFNHRADKIISFKTDSNGAFSFTPMKKGFYLIQSDTSSMEGFSLFHFSNEFPYVVHFHQLLEPLAYITSSNEFEKLSNAENTKQAIDDFWEENCGSKDRARESIKLYYSRVELANHYFTSYREGWRTDRGMIFLIFGPPHLVYRTNEAEKWFYGSDNGMMTEDFTFYKVNNPYSPNAFNLDRLATYKNLWYKIIEAWRDGRIY